MGLKETVKDMHSLLEHLVHNLRKAEKGNKAASQRVRTGSIKLSKIAKVYRKESVQEEKKVRKTIKKAKKIVKKAAKKAAKKKKR